jgi:hypothetical protein
MLSSDIFKGNENEIVSKNTERTHWLVALSQIEGTYSSVAPLNWIKVVWPDARGTTTAALKNPTIILESFMVID